MKTIKELFGTIKRFFTAEQNQIVSAAGVLIVISLVTKALGMFFLTLVAKEFGTSIETDLFYLASVLPETITNIILLGVISSSVIPIFIHIKEKDGESQFFKSFSSTINASMLFFVLLAILAAVFSRQLIPLAIGMAGKEQFLTDGQMNQVVWMMRVLLIPQIVLGLSAFFSTWLNIYQRFLVPQLAPLFFNIGKILGVLIMVPLMGGSIWGLVWGSLLGSVLHLLIQLPLLKTLKFNLKLFFVDLKDKNFLRVLKLGLPRVFSLSIEQVAVIVDSVIALGLRVGSLTAYQLAIRLVALPMGIFGTNFAIASYPSFSRLYAKEDKKGFSELFYSVIHQILFLSFPLAVIFIVMRVPIVRLVYGIFGGNFTWDDTLLVSWIVLFFSLGLIFEGLRTVIFRIYFAVHNSWIPLFSSLFIVVVGITTGILFSNYFSHFNVISLQTLTFDWSYFVTKGDGIAGAAGLALSSSFTFSLEFLLLTFILFKKKIVTNFKPFFIGFVKKFIAALIMGIACYFMAKLWEEVLNTTKTPQLIFLSISTMLSSLMIYIWSCYFLKIEEVEYFINLTTRSINKVLKKFFKKGNNQNAKKD
jgi:putative peptidoglycan lipid II flippase